MQLNSQHNTSKALRTAYVTRNPTHLHLPLRSGYIAVCTGRRNFPLLLHMDYNSERDSRGRVGQLLNEFLNCSLYGEEGGNSLFLCVPYMYNYSKQLHCLRNKYIHESGRGLFLKCFQNSAWGRLLFGVHYLSQISCLNKITLNDKNKSILNHEIYKKN